MSLYIKANKICKLFFSLALIYFPDIFFEFCIPHWSAGAFIATTVSSQSW